MEAISKFSGFMASKFQFVAMVVLLLAVYGYIYKIPLVCYGCESPSGVSAMFFKCIIDTSKDSELCKISKNIDNLPAQIVDAGQRITTAIVQEVTENIPATIDVAYNNLLREIQKIVDLIMSNIDNFKLKVMEFIQIAYEEVANVVIKTKDDLYKFLIQPIIKFITDYITTPIGLLIAKLIEFKDLIARSIETASLEVTGVVVKLRDNLITAIASIPKYLEEFLNVIIDIINTTTEGTVDGVNTAMSEVVKGTNTAVGGLATGVNASTAGITAASKAVAKSIETGVNGMITGINKGVILGINTSLTESTNALKTALNDGVIKPLNISTRGMSNAVNSSINPIVGVVNKTVDGVNSIRNISLPKLEIPRLTIPEVDLKITKIPETLIINNTLITPELKPFLNMPPMANANPINVSIPTINDINIPYPKKIEDVQGVTFDLNYSIPEIKGPDPSDPKKFISIKPDLIPKPPAIMGGTPRDGKKNLFQMNKGGFLPQLKLDPVVTVVTNELKKPITEATNFITNIYNKTMEPINKIIQDLTGLSETIKASLNYLFEKFLNMKYFWMMIDEIKKGVNYTYEQVIIIITEKVITPVYNLLMTLKEQLMKQINNVIKIIQGFFEEILSKLQELFGRVAEVLYETGKVVVSSAGYFLFYNVASTVDKIPLPVNVTAKMNIIILTIVFFVYILIEYYLYRIYDFMPYILTGILLLIGMSYTFINSSDNKIQEIQEDPVLAIEATPPEEQNLDIPNA